MQIFIQTMNIRAIKTDTNQRQRYTQLSPQKPFSSWILLQYSSIESHSNLIIRRCLANTTQICPHFSISYLIAGSSLNESNAFVHPCWQGEKNSTNKFVSGRSQHLHPSVSTRSSYWRFFASSVLMIYCNKVTLYLCYYIIKWVLLFNISFLIICALDLVLIFSLSLVLLYIESPI